MSTKMLDDKRVAFFVKKHISKMPFNNNFRLILLRRDIQIMDAGQFRPNRKKKARKIQGCQVVGK